MTARAPVRFGVVAPVTGDVPAWRDQLRGLADSGYSTIEDEAQDGVGQAGALVWAATDLAQMC